MRILILGSGGREHAFAHQIAKSPLCSQLFVAPGNAGTALCATNVNVKVDDFNAIANFVLCNDVQMVVVGPEAPLVAGIVDFFKSDPRLRHISVVGPSRQGALLEGSKDFAKAFMSRHAIPTAQYRTFTRDTIDEGVAFLATLQPPYVLKADGLAAGKGVLILDNLADAQTELRAMLADAKFGEASSRVVVEQYLTGIELSVFVLTDGSHYLILPEAKDYKRIGEGDTGLNTGGMGSVSPLPFADAAFMRKVEDRIVRPTVQGLRRENIDYKGFIFLGLMNCDGDPFVIEYNARMGDPETESVLLRINTDLVRLLDASCRGSLDKISLDIDPRSAACVMMVANGYPEHYVKGTPIAVDSNIRADALFHCGTRLDDRGNIVTNGGRVMCVSCLADTLPEALNAAYQAVDAVHYEGKYFRRDVGQDVLNFR